MSTAIQTDLAPEPEQPAAQAIRVGDLLFVSLQLPIDPVTDKVISGDLALRSHQAMSNLQAVLEAGGSRVKDIVRINAYLTDLTKIEDVRSVFRAYLGGDLPAMSLVKVGALPRGAAVGIEAIAVVQKGPLAGAPIVRQLSA